MPNFLLHWFVVWLELLRLPADANFADEARYSHSLPVINDESMQSALLGRLSNYPNLASFQNQFAQLLDKFNDTLVEHKYFVGINVVLCSLAFFYLLLQDPNRRPPPPTAASKLLPKMSAQPFAVPDVQLDPPKDTPITTAELKKYNGTDEKLPIYVAIKGKIFDVSAKKEMYGPGAGYNVFAGKDGSAGLGKSSLKPEDAIADFSALDASELKVLDDWVSYFTKRYNIVGKVVD